MIGAFFIDKFVKGIFPVRHEVFLYNSVPVPMFDAIIKTEKKKHQDK